MPVNPVHVLSVPVQERVHHFGHRRVRRFDQQVKMVSQQAKCMNPNCISGRIVAEAAEKKSVVAVAMI